FPYTTLFRSVPVARDGAGAEVDVAAQDRVAHVRQVGHLAFGADARLLDFDERADASPLLHDGAGPQVRVRAHGAPRADAASFDDGPLHRRAPLDDAVGDVRVGPDAAVFLDARVSADERKRQHGDVRRQGDVGVDVHRVRVDDGDALQHPVLDDAAAVHGLGPGQLDAGVDAENFVGVRGDHGLHEAPALGQYVHRVGQVVLALRVVGPHGPQRFKQAAAVEAVGAAVDLAD